jgi:hypothetical protein
MSEVADTVELAKQTIFAQLEPRFLKNDDGREFLLIPPNPSADHAAHWEHLDVTPPNKLEVLAPKIITQAVKLQNVDTLCEYVNRFKNPDSALFADISSNTILAVIDYHTGAIRPPSDGQDAPKAIADPNPKAAHTKHTASLTIPYSLEWQTWTGIDGQMMSHVDFANFLEENALDIVPLGQLKDSAGNLVEDAPTTIYELVREMQLRSSYGAASVVRNGDYISVEMQKGDDITTKTNVSLPGSIQINIPVYFGEHAVLVEALMRQKVVDGKIKMGVKLRRPEQYRQDEFKRIVDEVRGQVELTTLYGKPA